MMLEVSIETLRKSVEGLHDCKATFRETVHITEAYEGDVVWEGDVFVFDLEDHRTAKNCYAWSSPVKGSKKRRFYAVLHDGPVESAQDAVKASIIEDYKRD